MMKSAAGLFVLLMLSNPLYAATQNAVPPIDTGSMMRMLLGLALVLALLFGLAWLTKRYLAPQRGAFGAIKIVAATAVGQRERIVLVEIGQTWLVVGVAPGNVRSLHAMEKIDLADEPAAPAEKNFNSWLKQIIEKRNAG